MRFISQSISVYHLPSLPIALRLQTNLKTPFPEILGKVHEFCTVRSSERLSGRVRSSDTSSLERTGSSQEGLRELKVGLSVLVSGRGPLESSMVRSGGLSFGRVSSRDPEGWLELTSFCKGFTRVKVGSLEQTVSESAFQCSAGSLHSSLINLL